MWQRMGVLERCVSEECMREKDVNDVKRYCVERGLGNMVMTPKEVGKCMLNVFGANYKAK
jgi:hypothetical protein